MDGGTDVCTCMYVCMSAIFPGSWVGTLLLSLWLCAAAACCSLGYFFFLVQRRLVQVRSAGGLRLRVAYAWARPRALVMVVPLGTLMEETTVVVLHLWHPSAWPQES